MQNASLTLNFTDKPVAPAPAARPGPRSPPAASWTPSCKPWENRNESNHETCSVSSCSARVSRPRRGPTEGLRGSGDLRSAMWLGRRPATTGGSVGDRPQQVDRPQRGGNRKESNHETCSISGGGALCGDGAGGHGRGPRRRRGSGRDPRTGLARRPPVAAGPLDRAGRPLSRPRSPPWPASPSCAKARPPRRASMPPTIRKTVDYLVSRSCRNGLIGDPLHDDRYTYGHGFSMLFLSQVLGEEEDLERRKDLIDVLTRAVEFTGRAQTKAGGWGYVSAKDGGDFDEGSTTITQVQGLRGCRNAGIPVPKEIIDKAVGLHPQVHRARRRRAVQLAAAAAAGPPSPPRPSPASSTPATTTTSSSPSCWNTAGRTSPTSARVNNSGHWHYAHYYYSQVLYREGGKQWDTYRKAIYRQIVADAGPDGSWDQGFMGPCYTTAMNLTILQLDRGTLPIYQRCNAGPMHYRTCHPTSNRRRSKDSSRRAAKDHRPAGPRHRRPDRRDRRAADLPVQPGALPAGRRAGPGQDADDQHAQPDAEPELQPHPVHARPHAGRHHGHRRDRGEPQHGQPASSASWRGRCSPT